MKEPYMYQMGLRLLESKTFETSCIVHDASCFFMFQNANVNFCECLECVCSEHRSSYL